MKTPSIFTLLLLAVGFCLLRGETYFPPRGEWAERTPDTLGIDAEKLEEAVEFAQANEYSGHRDLRVEIASGFSREPYHEIVGPTKDRGGPAGMILKDGYVVAQWGDPKRVDMTFSVTKSYLSTVAGLAVMDGLIPSVQDPVGQSVWDGTFDGAHNSQITWEHLLNQSSDWSGRLFGQPDWGDRPARDAGLDDWRFRELHEPGTYYKYNDVRVNLLAYSLLQVWRRPLPQVLKERLMDPIGGSTTWRWYGYDSSWVNVDGVRVQSVSGGGHSGGGIFISTEDHARFGLLFLNDGVWNGQRLVTSEWIESARQPSAANESYGYMWWINRGDRKWEGLSEDIYYASGFGGNYIVIDPTHNVVVVLRWLEPGNLGEFMQKLSRALD